MADHLKRVVEFIDSQSNIEPDIAAIIYANRRSLLWYAADAALERQASRLETDEEWAQRLSRSFVADLDHEGSDEV